MYFPGVGISYQYLPASLCHGVAIDWVWSRIVLKNHARDVVLIMHADVFPYQQQSIWALLRDRAARGGSRGSADGCHVTGRRWTRCFGFGDDGRSHGGAGRGHARDEAQGGVPPQDELDGPDDRVCMWHFDTGLSTIAP